MEVGFEALSRPQQFDNFSYCLSAQPFINRIINLKIKNESIIQSKIKGNKGTYHYSNGKYHYILNRECFFGKNLRFW